MFEGLEFLDIVVIFLAGAVLIICLVLVEIDLRKTGKENEKIEGEDRVKR